MEPSLELLAFIAFGLNRLVIFIRKLEYVVVSAATA